MLPRILEPEVMDSDQEALDYDTMDHTAVNRVFVDDLLTACVAPPTHRLGDVLDLGTGTALIPVELAEREPHCRIMAADAAVSMLELARYRVEAAGLIERVQLTQADAKQLGFADALFDTVMSNSIVHHIPEPRTVLGESVRVVKPGGLLFFRDLLRPDNATLLTQLVGTYAAEATERQRDLFAASLHAALTLDEVRAMVASLGFAADTVQATSDRHWTWSARKPTPN
jgi:ubiquinone/menaquinone biosynthesis C-methylase UbiE